MVLEKCVDILFAVESPVQENIDLLVSHDIKLRHKLLNSFDISDIARELSIVEG